MNLTVRIEDGDGWICDDEGRGAELRREIVDLLTESWAGVEPTDREFLTAAVRADLGSARVARPRPSSREPSCAEALTGERTLIGQRLVEPSAPLAQVLDRRYSAREFGACSIDALATVLVRGARLRDLPTVALDGDEVSHRPAPSAGARHPFALHLFVGEAVSGIAPGQYIFDPLDCSLVLADSEPDPTAETLIRLAGHLGSSSSPAAAVFLVADLTRTLRRYPSGLSLVWRDAGALLQTLHLCSVDVGLASCIVGTAGFLGDRSSARLDVGGLALGG